VYIVAAMSRHIGIVGCSSEGAALCYKTICVEGTLRLGPHAHPEVSMHTHSLADYVDCLNRGDVEGVGELMLSSASKLQRAGADFLICPDNTIHQAMAYVAARSPMPWLHIAEVVAAEAVARGYRRVALTGTRWLVESEVYPEKLAAVGVDYVRPSKDECARLGEIIMDELVFGTFKSDSVAYLQSVIGRLRRESCDAVVLGCTELPLILDDSNSPLPTLDSTRLLARAALDRALSAQA
jgi:aspartate racemase